MTLVDNDYDILRIHFISWIKENMFVDIKFHVLDEVSAYKPREHLLFVEHLFSWFTCIHEIQENWYLMNNNVNIFKLILFGAFVHK